MLFDKVWWKESGYGSEKEFKRLQIIVKNYKPISKIYINMVYSLYMKVCLSLYKKELENWWYGR